MQWQPHAVGAWPDDPEAPTEACRDCRKPFATVARHPDGRRCGRDRCPHCGRARQIPQELHDAYVRGYGLVEEAVRAAVRQGVSAETAERAAADAYDQAILRWVPELSSFRNFCGMHMANQIRHAAAAAARGPRFYQESPYEVVNAVAPTDGAYNRTKDQMSQVPADADDPLETMVAAEEITGLRKALKKLDKRQRRFANLRYGLGGRTPMSLQEIGDRFKLTRERARQIESEILTILKQELSDA